MIQSYALILRLNSQSYQNNSLSLSQHSKHSLMLLFYGLYAVLLLILAPFLTVGRGFIGFLYFFFVSLAIPFIALGIPMGTRKYCFQYSHRHSFPSSRRVLSPPLATLLRQPSVLSFIRFYYYICVIKGKYGNRQSHS